MSIEEPDPEYKDAYERALALLALWMTLAQKTLEGAAAFLGVNRVMLTKFRNRAEGGPPRKRRQRQVEILQRVLEKCQVPAAHENLPPPAGGDEFDDNTAPSSRARTTS